MARQPDGASAEDHSGSAARIIGKLANRVKVVKVEDGADVEPEFPEPLAYLWGWFCEISEGLPMNGMAPPAPSWTDIASWATLMRRRPDPWETMAIVTLGALRATIQAKSWEKSNGKQN